MQKLQIRNNTCMDYDLAFRDTIATIDYQNGTFAVNNHTQTITTDEDTYIWGIHTQNQINNQVETNVRANQDISAGDPGYGSGEAHHMAEELVFTDLAVGDIVEVKANIVNEETLYALKIKLANASHAVCETFEASIASIDLETGTVTFDGYDWIAVVCPQVCLNNPDGGAINLEDFAVGDYVSVKGYPTDDEFGFKICQMELLEP